MLLIFKTMYEDHKQIFKIEMKLTNMWYFMMREIIIAFLLFLMGKYIAIETKFMC